MEVKNNDLELKVRIVKGEIRETKRKKEKFLNITLGLGSCFISLIIGSIYFFVVKKEEYKLWHILFIGFFGLFSLFFGYYSYNKWQKECQKLEKLEKELKRLKEGLKV